MARRKKWLTAIALVGAIVSMVPEIRGMISYYQQPELTYTTNELTAYPIVYHDNRPAPEDIQSDMLRAGPVKIVSVVVQNKGERSASDVVVRFPVLPADEYLGGWMTSSEDGPTSAHMLGGRREWSFRRVIPGDTIAFDLYLRSAGSDLASRVGVFYGDGRRAAYYQYAPVSLRR